MTLASKVPPPVIADISSWRSDMPSVTLGRLRRNYTPDVLADLGTERDDFTLADCAAAPSLFYADPIE